MTEHTCKNCGLRAAEYEVKHRGGMDTYLCADCLVRAVVCTICEAPGYLDDVEVVELAAMLSDEIEKRMRNLSELEKALNGSD